MMHIVLEWNSFTLSQEKHWSRHLRFKIWDRSRHFSYKTNKNYIQKTITRLIQHLTGQMLSVGTWLSDLLSSLSSVLHYVVLELSSIPSATFTPLSSHDHLCIVDWPQIGIIKASPDTPPDGISAPVRLVSQIWRRRNTIQSSQTLSSELLDMLVAYWAKQLELLLH